MAELPLVALVGIIVIGLVTVTAISGNDRTAREAIRVVGKYFRKE